MPQKLPHISSPPNAPPRRPVRSPMAAHPRPPRPARRPQRTAPARRRAAPGRIRGTQRRIDVGSWSHERSRYAPQRACARGLWPRRHRWVFATPYHRRVAPYLLEIRGIGATPREHPAVVGRLHRGRLGDHGYLGVFLRRPHPRGATAASGHPRSSGVQHHCVEHRDRRGGLGVLRPLGAAAEARVPAKPRPPTLVSQRTAAEPAPAGPHLAHGHRASSTV